MDQEQIDVALSVPITARCGPENAPVQGLGVPRTERLPEAVPELKAQAGKQSGDRGTEMFPVELVDTVPAHLRGTYDSLLDQAAQALAHTDLRSAWRLRGDFACGQWLAGPGQRSQNRAIQRRSHRPGRVSQVHYPKV
jgi:hypothetical protein